MKVYGEFDTSSFEIFYKKGGKNGIRQKENKKHIEKQTIFGYEIGNKNTGSMDCKRNYTN